MAARKWAHWARNDAVKASSRERPPVGETSCATPLSSFQTCSGLMPAAPLLPLRPTPTPPPSADMAPVPVAEDRGPVLAHDVGAPRLLAPAAPLGLGERGAHPGRGRVA